MFQGWTFLQSIHHTLMHYRDTQHPTTVISATALMLGLELRLPLNRLRPTLPQKPLPRNRGSVACQQRKMKQRFDISACVKAPDIKAVDLVRVCRPHRGNKLVSYWTSPPEVNHKLGMDTFLLNDDTYWHASCLRKVLLFAQTTGITSQAPSPACHGPLASQMTPQAAPVQASDMSISLPSDTCTYQSQAAQSWPCVSPQLVRICSHLGQFWDFVSTFHI